jgi:integrase
MSSSPAVKSQCPASFALLFSECREYGLRIRNIQAATVTEEIRYIERFIKMSQALVPQELFAELTPQFVQHLVFEYRKFHSLGSCRNFQVYLRMFLRFCYFHKYIESNVSEAVPSVRKYKLSTTPRSISDELIGQLLNGIVVNTPAAMRDMAIIPLLVIYGVRSIQLRHLRLTDIDWAKRIIVFPAAKGGKPIRQYLTTAAGNALTLYLKDSRPKSDLSEVFLTLTPPCRPIQNSSYMSGIIRRHLDCCHISLPEGVSMGTHAFRHSFATRLIADTPFEQLAVMLGHKDPSSTLIYAKINFSMLKTTAMPWPEV